MKFRKTNFEHVKFMCQNARCFQDTFPQDGHKAAQDGCMLASSLPKLTWIWICKKTFVAHTIYVLSGVVLSRAEPSLGQLRRSEGSRAELSGAHHQRYGASDARGTICFPKCSDKVFPRCETVDIYDEVVSVISQNYCQLLIP